MAADILSQVLEFDIGAVDALYELFGCRQHTFDTAEGRERVAQGFHDAGTLGRESVVSGVEGTLDVLGMGHRVALLFEFFLFAFV